MPSLPPTFKPETPSIKEDPFKRLSTAVKELNRLIGRAKQLAELTEKPPARREKPCDTLAPPPVASDKE